MIEAQKHWSSMRSFFYLSILSSTLLFAEQPFELFGERVEAEGSKVHATDQPVFLYQDQIMNANEVWYDRNTSDVEAIGNVNGFKAGQYYTISEYSKLNINNETRYSKPFYLFDAKSGLWMSTEEASGCKNEINLASGMVSGCDSSDPLWKIHFSSADYDSDAQWMNMYNARIKIRDIPVFYLPYFGYPTDTTRRSGLLFPLFGLSSFEGLYYEQPIYIAPQKWWDWEIRPQIRTNRGSGVYSDFRFVDTASSFGSIRVGQFNEQPEYALRRRLANQKHYGYTLKYQHTAFLKEWFDLDLEGTSGLFVNGSWMNDVDYINLSTNDQIQNVTANQVFSRINGFYNGSRNYAAAYFKHFQYLDRQSNGQTIQTLPALHYHRYLESMLNDHLLFNVDTMVTNYYRPDGKRAVEGIVDIPLTFQAGLFDNYLDLSYTAKASARAMSFYGNIRSNEIGTSSDLYEPGRYAQLDHTLKVGSTLVKPYDQNITHVLAPEISYTMAGKRLYSGYYDTYQNSCDPTKTPYATYPCEFFTLSAPSDRLSLGVNNYLYHNGKQLIVDRLSQNFRYQNGATDNGELQNELELQLTDQLAYYNLTAYHNDRRLVTREQNTINYTGDKATLGLSHYYTDNLLENKSVTSSYVTANGGYRYNDYYRYFGSIAYDYKEALIKQYELGFLYTQRCWDFGIRLVNNRRPILSMTGLNNYVDETYMFITVTLKPIGGMIYNYKMSGR